MTDTIDGLLRQFRLETTKESVFEAFLVSCGGLVNMMERRDCTAAKLVKAIAEWQHHADNLVDQNRWPACAVCAKPVRHGEVTGFFCVLPINRNAVGLVAAICGQCGNKDVDFLIANATDAIRQELGSMITIHGIH